MVNWIQSHRVVGSFDVGIDYNIAQQAKLIDILTPPVSAKTMLPVCVNLLSGLSVHSVAQSGPLYYVNAKPRERNAQECICSRDERAQFVEALTALLSGLSIKSLQIGRSNNTISYRTYFTARY